MKKWIILSILVVAVGGVGAWFLLRGNDQVQTASAQTQTTTVQKGKLEVAVSGSGSVEAITDEDVTAANTVLIVDSVSVSSGDTVSEGDTLVTFENGDTVTAPYDGEITSVKVEGGSGATQGAVLLRMENEDDIESPITRETTSDSSIGSRTTASGSLTVDTVSVEEGDTVKKGATIASFADGSVLKTPAAGTVTSLSVESGDSIQSADVVAHITNYEVLKTTISVDELDISKVKEGQSVTVTASAFEDEEFTGEVTNVATVGTSENGVSTFDVTVKIADAKDLKIGMSAEATISIESKDDALYVPVEAVYTSDEEKYVLVPSSSSDEEAQSAEKVTVETGIANDTYVEVTSGLSEGDTIQLPNVQSSGNSSQEGMMIPGGFDQSGQMPSGDFPSGGPGGAGEQPSGNNQGGN